MNQKGFTLMELMIVVAIVGIIAAVAYPSYQESVLKSRRADGTGALMGFKLAQEKLRANCKFYAQSVVAGDADDNVCDAGSAGNTVVGYRTTSSEGYYTLSVAPGTASGVGYTLRATPIGTQASDTACNPITLTVSNSNSDGAKGPLDKCWGK